MSAPRRRPVPRESLTLVARTGTDFPGLIVYLVKYASSANVPSVYWLRRRIARLQELYPFLAARVVAHEGDWVYEEDTSLDIERDILRTADVTETSERVHGAPYDSPDLQVLTYDLERFKQRVLRVRTQWQVTRYLRGGDGPAYLAVAVQHALVDGMGGLTLLQRLLAPGDAIASLKREDFWSEGSEIPYEVDDEAFSKRFPSKTDGAALQAAQPAAVTRTTPAETFPKNEQPLEKPPTEYCPRHALFTISPETLQAIARLGKAEGIATLTPVLTVAFAIALVNVLKEQSGSTPRIIAGMATSDRANLREASSIFNYHAMGMPGPYEHDPSADFWTVVRPISDRLVDPEQWRTSRERYAQSRTYTEAREKLGSSEGLVESIGTTPFIMSYGFTNLTRTSLPPNAIDLFWTQDAQVFFPAPIIINGFGHEGGARFVPAWREGCVFTEARVQAVLAKWAHVLAQLAAGRRTIGDLA